MRSIVLLSILFLSGLNSAWSASYKPADFAKDEAYYSAKISPTGEYIAMGMIREGEQVLGVWDIKKNKIVGGAQFSYPKQTGEFYWVNDERLVIQLVEANARDRTRYFYGELYSVNYDGSKPKLIYGYSNSDRDSSTRLSKRESTRGWAFIAGFLPDDDRHILINSVPMSEDHRSYSTLEKLNVYSGKMTKVMSSPTYTYNSSGFILDSNDQPRYFFGQDKDANSDFYEYNLKEQTWGRVTSIEKNSFRPLTLSDDDKSLFYYNDNEAGFRGVYKYDIASGKSKHIYTDEKVDISDVAYNDDRSSVYAARVDNGYTEYVIIDKRSEEAKILRSLLGTFVGHNISITSSTSDGNISTILVSSDVDAGMFYLFDRTKNSLSGLFPFYNGIAAKDMAKTTPYNVTASDGIEIPVFLTLPNNVKGPVPLVTLVHGGPRSRDYWGYDSEVQMLANEGYAVLRVNYRGSFGYGTEFMMAGNEHWGDRIQWDIIDATNWARGQDIIDGEKVCIMGGSFGGYSAVQSSILGGDTFKCAVANAGIYDLEELFEEGDISEFFGGESYLKDVLGTDKVKLHAFSPTKNADKLNIPVFIAHGKKDERAPYEQAEGLRDALEDADKDYEWFVRSTESHGFTTEENRSEYFEEVSDFLKKHLK